MARKPIETPELPPLFADPTPFHPRSNGGPPLEPRRPGRPPIGEEVRERICELLAEGIPMRRICLTEGFPNRVTVHRWRAKDPEFDRSVELSVQWGRDALVHAVSREFDEIIRSHPPKVARKVFSLRRRELTRLAPKYFGGPF